MKREFNRIIEIAKENIILSRNFIHDIGHTIRVHDNTLEIALKQENISNDDINTLRIAAYWHDVGQNDFLKDAKFRHEQLSVKMLEIACEKENIQSNNIELVKKIILNHRNRGKIREINNDDILSRILWDADKLDIINYTRMYQIISYYKNNSMVGNYGYQSSIEFWDSIDEKFVEKFNFEASREIFRKKYSDFKYYLIKLKEEKEY